MPLATDILVDTANPELLDQRMQTFGCALVGGPGHYRQVDGYYVLRTFQDPDLAESIMTAQGYATVICRLFDVL